MSGTTRSRFLHMRDTVLQVINRRIPGKPLSAAIGDRTQKMAWLVLRGLEGRLLFPITQKHATLHPMSIVEIFSGLSVENRLMANEIEEKNDFSSLIIDSSIDGILACNASGEYTVWNPVMEKITGLKKSQVLGKRWDVVFPFLKGTPVEEAFAQTLNGQTVELPPMPYHVAESGARGYTQQSNTPIFNVRNEVVGMLVVVRDVTQAKSELEVLIEENRALKARIEAMNFIETS